MNELIGTSYFYLKQIFGEKVKPNNYEAFSPKGPEIDEKDNKTLISDEINMVQSVGKDILIQDGMPIASMMFSELPTEWNKIQAPIDMFASLQDIGDLQTKKQTPDKNEKIITESDDTEEETDESEEEEDAPIVAPIANPIVAPIVAPIANPIAAPIVAPIAPIAPIVDPIVAPIAAPIAAVSASTPSIEKYEKMLKAGVPIAGVKAKMKLEGVDPSLLDNLSAVAPKANIQAQPQIRPGNFLDELNSRVKNRTTSSNEAIESALKNKTQAPVNNANNAKLDLMTELKQKLAKRQQENQETVEGIATIA